MVNESEAMELLKILNLSKYDSPGGREPSPQKAFYAPKNTHASARIIQLV